MEDMEATELSEGRRPLSTTVGLRDRVPGAGTSADPPYMLMVLAWVSPKSCMSRKYAITERKARVRASRAFSSSRRCICSMEVV